MGIPDFDSKYIAQDYLCINIELYFLNIVFVTMGFKNVINCF